MTVVDRPEADALIARLVSAADALGARRHAEILRALGRVGARFLDPADPLRKEAEERIPSESGLSSPMVAEVIGGMAREWTADRLRALVLADFPDPEMLDGFKPGPNGAHVRAVAGPFAFHMGSGNVPGVGATSLIRSLLVKCPVLLKPGRSDLALSVLFARGLAEEDEEIAGAAAVVYWPIGEGGHLEAAALAAAERVVAYGGPTAIAYVRERMAPQSTLVAYPHRMSAGVVSREELGSQDRAGRVARDAARAVAIFDQRGCVSPQVVWVEDGGTITPRAWAESLAQELDALERALPPGAPDSAAASQAHQVRETARLRQAAGAGDEVLSIEGQSWAVLFEPEERELAPCQGRTARVRPIEDLSGLERVLRPHRSTLQTVALAAPEARQKEIAGVIARAGATRITSFRDQPWPPAWWRHDGQGPLVALARWVGLEG